MTMYPAYCPNCDHKVWIEEERHNYTILSDYVGHPISKCPKCGIELKVENGELKKDE